MLESSAPTEHSQWLQLQVRPAECFSKAWNEIWSLNFVEAEFKLVSSSFLMHAFWAWKQEQTAWRRSLGSSSFHFDLTDQQEAGGGLPLFALLVWVKSPHTGLRWKSLSGHTPCRKWAPHSAPTTTDRRLWAAIRHVTMFLWHKWNGPEPFLWKYTNTPMSTGQSSCWTVCTQTNLPDRPTCCPSTVAYRCVMFREYPPNGRWGSSVRVMGTEMLMGPESSSRRGTWVLDRAWPLVTTTLSGVVDSFRPCFIVSFSDTQKSSSLKRSRKVFQSCKRHHDRNMCMTWCTLTCVN